MELKKNIYQSNEDGREKTDFLKEEKIEMEKSQSGFFACLENQVKNILNSEEREQSENFINELRTQCRDYLKILENYHLAEKEFNEASIGDQEDKDNARLVLENATQERVSKKSVILDNLNILNRLFTSYGLECSWYHGFENEEQFEGWVFQNVKELEN